MGVSDGDAGEKVYADYSDMPVSGSPGADRECVVEKGYAVMQALVDLAKGLNVLTTATRSTTAARSPPATRRGIPAAPSSTPPPLRATPATEKLGPPLL